MGQVVPFIARVRDSGDWTEVERARLQEVADRLAAGGVHVEVIFGRRQKFPIAQRRPHELVRRRDLMANKSGSQWGGGSLIEE